MKKTRDHIDFAYWQNPVGVKIPDDELSFLLVPDSVEAAACFELARQVHGYQDRMRGKQGEITATLMVTMGGLLPGILLYDHLTGGRRKGTSKIQFGTIGVSGYKGPGERYGPPRVQDKISIPVSGHTVLIIDDLGDSGDTLQFLSEYVLDCGARKALILALYLKPRAMQVCAADFFFGEIPQDTWIITPRERIETLMKRVPVWKQRGATEQECRRRLCDLIGYSESEVNYYLPIAYAQG